MISISPGHWHVGTGARAIIDEVTEARKIVNLYVKRAEENGIKVNKIVDQQSKNQQQNLMYLVNQHNQTKRSLDISIHFNAVAGIREQGIGVEVLYRDDKLKSFASGVSSAIHKVSGLKNRGPKKRSDLAFLNKTAKPAILVEVCFVNSKEDVRLYQQHLNKIVDALIEQCAKFIGYSIPAQIPLEASIQNRVAAIWSNKKEVRKILVKAIAEKIIQKEWLEKFEQNKLTIHDWTIICTLLLYRKL